MANLKTSVIVVILGEGGSGGALAIGVGDRVLMLENAVYSVITPEGCAAILWKDSGEASRAAESLKLTADNLKKFGLIDEIISESSEWRIAEDDLSEAGKLYLQTAEILKRKILSNLKEIEKLSVEERLNQRFNKFRKMGDWVL
jgi:acetyl-CoA carboxylase carboxyl transferase subunit alpha